MPDVVVPVELLTLEEAKVLLRVDSSDDGPRITLLLEAAVSRLLAEVNLDAVPPEGVTDFRTALMLLIQDLDAGTETMNTTAAVQIVSPHRKVRV
jgi:hypothetical protein